MVSLDAPATRVVQHICVYDVEYSHRCVGLLVQLPHKRELDRALPTVRRGVTAPKEWLGRHVAYGLGLLHAHSVHSPRDHEVTVSVDIAQGLRIRNMAEFHAWDGRSFTVPGGTYAFLHIEHKRQKTPTHFIAEWHLYDGLRVVSSKLLVGGWCAYEASANREVA